MAHETNFQGSVSDAIRQAITGAIADAEVEVSGGGGHWTVAVTSRAFEGKNTLARHRLVLSAIAPLMEGEGAPVHAVDSLSTDLPA